jgi:hypothetical protein
MDTSPTAKQALIARIVELMEETETDIVDLFLEIFANWDDENVLALLPETSLKAAVAYLEQERAAHQDEEVDTEYIDLSAREEGR